MNQRSTSTVKDSKVSLSGNTGSEIVRPSVSMEERHVQLLDEMAAEAYAGNRSACLRAAIKDHARLIIEGESDFDEVGTRLDEIEERIGDLQAQGSEQTASSSKNGTSDNGGNDGVKNQIYKIVSSNDAVELSHIISNIEADPVEVQKGIRDLCTRGLIDETEEESGLIFRVDVSGVNSE